ncbi:MAG: terminase [Acidobacteriaceae bacterium]|nr:terminase [Acidobacteriaceae bacterium]
MAPLKANMAQRQFEARRGQHNLVLKARQMGMTTWVAARFLLRTMTRPGTLTLEVAHTREAAESLLEMMRTMWRSLPRDLREGELRLSRSSSGRMVFGALGSEVRVASAAEANAGRGLSVQCLHCSEVARWPGDAAETLAGLRAALAPGGESVLESTPNGAYGAFYEEWTKGPEDVVRHFLPWWLEPSYIATPVMEGWDEEERAGAARYGWSAEQIGFRRTLQARFRALRTQEFAEDPESCFRATGTCWFDVEALERRRAEVMDPVSIRRNGALQVWLPPQAGRRYVLGVDVAGGGDAGDFAAVQVVDLQTGMQCAELQERLRPVELAKISAALAREYGMALIAVERNNHGSAVLTYLETVERYQNVYRQAEEAGWLTSVASKPEMLARLHAVLQERAGCVMSRRLLEECRTFVSTRNGRLGASAGTHDDLVMAMAIALSVREEQLR